MTDETGEVFDFASWLAEFGGGDANAIISAKMAVLNGRVEAVGDKGTLSLVFEVAPHKHGTCQVRLKSLKTSEPMEPVDSELFYHDQDVSGGLTRVVQRPPKQPSLYDDTVTPINKKAN